MEKQMYAMITPDPYDECETLIVPLPELTNTFEVFDDDISGQRFEVKLVSRTKRWYEKFSELT